MAHGDHPPVACQPDIAAIIALGPAIFGGVAPEGPEQLCLRGFQYDVLVENLTLGASGAEGQDIARFGIEGAFEVRPQEKKVLFIAEISLGTRLPILNWLSDIIMKTLFSDRLEAMRQHMVEEGQNLKGMLEEEFQ